MVRIEWFHHEIARSGMHCAGNLSDIIFVQANDRLRAVSAVHSPQFPEELTTVERRHPAIDENGVRHRKRANRERLANIGGFGTSRPMPSRTRRTIFLITSGVVHHQDVPHPRTYVPGTMIDGSDN
jgi:hypothetical protein